MAVTPSKCRCTVRVCPFSQDNFTFSEEYDSPIGVYEAIKDVEDNHIVTHENDRAWRTAVIMNKPSMLALRYQRTEDSYVYPYKLIRLTSKFIKFRVVKVCVCVCV